MCSPESGHNSVIYLSITINEDVLAELYNTKLYTFDLQNYKKNSFHEMCIYASIRKISQLDLCTTDQIINVCERCGKSVLSYRSVT